MARTERPAGLCVHSHLLLTAAMALVAHHNAAVAAVASATADVQARACGMALAVPFTSAASPLKNATIVLGVKDAPNGGSTNGVWYRVDLVDGQWLPPPRAHCPTHNPLHVELMMEDPSDSACVI